MKDFDGESRMRFKIAFTASVYVDIRILSLFVRLLLDQGYIVYQFDNNCS